MTDRERVLVLKLISAIDDFKLPIRGTLGDLPEMDAERERRAARLHEALQQVKEIV